MNSHYEKFLATGVVRCIDDEIPFEIPKGWEWCRMGEYLDLIGGYAFSSTDLKSDGKFRVIRISDIGDKGLINRNVVRYSGGVNLEQYRIYNGDILMAMTGGTVGKSLLVDERLSEPLLLNQRVVIIRSSRFNMEYINLLTHSPHILNVINNEKNSTNDNISMALIANFLLPIPPMEEQCRITKIWNELIPIIERYNVTQNSYDKLNSEIKGKLKKSILQEAIQGRLVPQIDEDGTAQELLNQIREERKRLVKDGKLKKSALSDSVIFKGADNRYYEQIGHIIKNIDGEIPFDIPRSWQWIRIKDIVQFNPKNDSLDDTESAFIPMDKINAGYGSSYTYDIVKWETIKRNFVHFADGDIAFAKITPCFQNRKSVIFTNLPNGIGAGTSELKVIRPYGETINRSYFLYLLKSPYFIDEAIFKGTANQQRILSGYLENKLFPIPPIKEQERIVRRIEQLMQLLK